MKNNFKYLLVLILLIALSGAVYFLVNKDMAADETQFAIGNTDQIYKIEMSNKFGNKMTLNKIDNEWYVNNNYTAQKYSLDAFLNLINKLEVVSNVAESSRKEIISLLATSSIKVSAFNKNGKEIKSFYAGGDAGSKGAFMILEKDGKIADNPYVVCIPGYRGQFIYNFTLDSIKWRSTKVFDTNYDDLAAITIDYESDKKCSFTVSLDEDEVVIKPLVDSVEIKNPVDREKMVLFLTEMSSKSFEYFANEDSLKSSIIQQKPFCTITTKRKNGVIKSMKMFYMPIHDRSLKVKDEKGNMLSIDEERFYGLIAGRNDFVVAQYYVFGIVLKRYSDFFKKEKT